VRRGIDPQFLKTEERVLAKRNAVAPRFASLCDEFVRDQSPGWRPSTKLGWLHHIESNIKPALGNKLPAEVTGDDVRALTDTMTNGIADGKAPDGTVRWKRRPAPTSARRCFEVLRRLFAWAVWRRLVPMSPCITARPFETSRRSGSRRASRRFKPYSDAQLQAIFSAAKGTELEHVLNLIARTGVRRHEALAARWEDIDFAKGLWRVPAEMHKVGEQTGAPHLVTLSRGALGIFTAARAASLKGGKRSPWVFPAATTTCYVCEQAGHADPANKAAKTVKGAAGIEDRGLLHRFRDTLKTRLSEHGIDSRVSEHILGHVVPGIAGVYDHAELLSQRREALDWWDGELDRVLKAEPKTERRVAASAARA
jgi:integrase